MTAEADLAIRRLIACYSDAIFRRDPDAFTACWLPDARWLYMDLEFRGHDTIRETYIHTMTTHPMAWMIANNILLEIDGDVAWGRLYINEVVTVEDGRTLAAMGIYHDRYRRVDGEFKFDVRHFEVYYNDAADMSGPFNPRPTFPASPRAAVDAILGE